MPRIAHVLTSVRSSQSAAATSPGSRPSTRACSVSSADDMTCACTPHSSPATSSIAFAGARSSSRWRRVRHAATSLQDSSAALMAADGASTLGRSMRWTTIDTPIGPLLAAGDDDGRLCGLWFDRAPRAGLAPRRRARSRPLREQLDAYFAGDLRAFDLPLAPRPARRGSGRCGTRCGRSRTGRRSSYGELARRLGRPARPRARSAPPTGATRSRCRPVPPAGRRARGADRLRRRASTQALAARARARLTSRIARLPPLSQQWPLPPFQAFFDSHRDEVLGFLSALVGPNEADDCFQETFVAALRAYPRLRADSNLRAWVLTIARRKAIDHHRARGRRALPSDDLPERRRAAGARRAARALGRRPRSARAPARGGLPALRGRPDPPRHRVGASSRARTRRART